MLKIRSERGHWDVLKPGAELYWIPGAATAALIPTSGQWELCWGNVQHRVERPEFEHGFWTPERIGEATAVNESRHFLAWALVKAADAGVLEMANGAPVPFEKGAHLRLKPNHEIEVMPPAIVRALTPLGTERHKLFISYRHADVGNKDGSANWKLLRGIARKDLRSLDEASITSGAIVEDLRTAMASAHQTWVFIGEHWLERETLLDHDLGDLAEWPTSWARRLELPAALAYESLGLSEVHLLTLPCEGDAKFDKRSNVHEDILRFLESDARVGRVSLASGETMSMKGRLLSRLEGSDLIEMIREAGTRVNGIEETQKTGLVDWNRLRDQPVVVSRIDGVASAPDPVPTSATTRLRMQSLGANVGWLEARPGQRPNDRVGSGISMPPWGDLCVETTGTGDCILVVREAKGTRAITLDDGDRIRGTLAVRQYLRNAVVRTPDAEVWIDVEGAVVHEQRCFETARAAAGLIDRFVIIVDDGQLELSVPRDGVERDDMNVLRECVDAACEAHDVDVTEVHWIDVDSARTAMSPQGGTYTVPVLGRLESGQHFLVVASISSTIATASWCLFSKGTDRVIVARGEDHNPAVAVRQRGWSWFRASDLPERVTVHEPLGALR